MIVYADKFQAIILKRNSDMSNEYTLNIGGSQVTSEKPVKLLAVNIDNKLSKLHKYLGCKEKEVLINKFVYANFN